ncbi:uncharacterized protein LOC119110918 [Pollicipes pollicipes]|uniref:uncharacterized protein LOC119091330 n=1 Tax=Pollicipes pollicipes TaxID=41117 RepID=UPI001884FAD1|nr:uncharacterized protein LOC119091330 [Pollicipes pollicipes]XP_037069952.1 uncharacterized protein LOC119091330 [Pollicipes pollicipes]XP_037069953.1 uncharacterized protein LOC119091330 [Pollicipes pollicipes]XP_037090688.1 uncharacterized protein LOC119110918 [Pollicipes pollicipes]
MHSHTCNCLNVRLDVVQLLAEPPADVPEPLQREPLLAAGCLWVLLGPDGASVEHATLLQQHSVSGASDWTVCRCLNCGCVTHATCDRAGAATAVSKYLLSEPARIAALQRSERYSPAFRIVLPQLAGALERSLAPPASPRSHPALTAALRHMKLNVTSFIKREEHRIETVVQNFRDEKLAELKESKQRAFEDSQAFKSLLLRVEDQLRLSADAGGAPLSSESEGQDTVPPLRSERRPSGVPNQDMVGVFLMDGDDIEVAEEVDEHFLQDDEEPDTDDSGVEEPRPLATPGRGSRAVDLAHSLPVHIPVPAAVLALGRQRPSAVEEEVPSIDQMADSIRQLAQSLHTEPGCFADLPRPRTNTMNR